MRLFPPPLELIWGRLIKLPTYGIQTILETPITLENADKYLVFEHILV
jgi:hypothetical protein